MVEFDLLRDQTHDVSNDQTWEHLCNLLDSRSFDVLVISPPCNTFSRARRSFRTSPGPKPLRNRHWPFGFPWLEGQAASDVALANLLIKRSVQACTKAHAVDTLFLFEHPEDLGRTPDDELPASIWQWPDVVQLLDSTGACTWALFQCEYGAEFGLACASSSKPTRLLSTLSAFFEKEPYRDWPTFAVVTKYVSVL